jgi:hypothetical protein
MFYIKKDFPYVSWKNLKLFFAYKCTVLLPPGDNPISVNKYIIYQISSHLLVLQAPDLTWPNVISFFVSKYYS